MESRILGLGEPWGLILGPKSPFLHILKEMRPENFPPLWKGCPK